MISLIILHLRHANRRTVCYTFSFKESTIIDFLCRREATPYNTKQPLSLISSPDTPANSLGSQFLRTSPIFLAADRPGSRLSFPPPPANLFRNERSKAFEGLELRVREWCLDEGKRQGRMNSLDFWWFGNPSYAFFYIVEWGEWSFGCSRTTRSV